VGLAGNTALQIHKTVRTESSSHIFFLRSWMRGRNVFNSAASAVLPTLKGWWLGGLEETKTAEYMMFQHVSNILPSFTFQESENGFPFETLLPATKVYAFCWDFKSTGSIYKILLQCYAGL
jgi:hypothetical protein